MEEIQGISYEAIRNALIKNMKADLKELYAYGTKDDHEHFVDRLSFNYEQDCECEIYGKCDKLQCLCFDCILDTAQHLIDNE